MSKTKLQFSAGGVVYRGAGRSIEIIILTRNCGQVFCLPKGKIEKPESPRETALREIKEETGLTGTIESQLGKINYWFDSDEDMARVHKTVYFYLVKYESGDVADHDTDAEDVRWLPMDEALKIMTYPSEREMASNANAELQGHQ